MTNDEKDRHVLAAAVRAGAHAILTENGKHFPAKSVEPYDIDVLTPDRFLAHQFHLNPELLEEKLCGQAKARGIPYDGLVHRLAKWAVIGFRDRRRGIVAALAMFVLGTLLEGGQRFSPGRAVEFGDVIANGAGVSCGTLLGLPIRACIAIL
jgi:hypothetical protein